MRILVVVAEGAFRAILTATYRLAREQMPNFRSTRALVAYALSKTIDPARVSRSATRARTLVTLKSSYFVYPNPSIRDKMDFARLLLESKG